MKGEQDDRQISPSCAAWQMGSCYYNVAIIATGIKPPPVLRALQRGLSHPQYNSLCTVQCRLLHQVWLSHLQPEKAFLLCWQHLSWHVSKFSLKSFEYYSFKCADCWHGMVLETLVCLKIFWSGLVWSGHHEKKYLLASMLKIYIYWNCHACPRTDGKWR